MAPPECSPTADILGMLVSLIGKADAFTVVERYGGTRVLIPHQYTEDSPIARDIGIAAAAKLSPVFGGDIITIPVARSWRAQVYRERGLSYPKIARLLGCHEDTVHRHLKAAGMTNLPKQNDNVTIDLDYWRDLAKALRNSIPRDVSPTWPLMVHAYTLTKIVGCIERDLLGAAEIGAAIGSGIDLQYWRGAAETLRNSAPCGVPPNWPIAVHAATLSELVDRIERDLLGTATASADGAGRPGIRSS